MSLFLKIAKEMLQNMNFRKKDDFVKVLMSLEYKCLSIT